MPKQCPSNALNLRSSSPAPKYQRPLLVGIFIRRTQMPQQHHVSASVTNFPLEIIFSHFSPETGNGVVPSLVDK